MAGVQEEVKQDGAQRLDPLVLLRKCATTGQHVQYDYEHLAFGHYRVHKNTKCAFRPSKAEPFMDIGSIWYMYHEVSREDGSYHAKAARQRGFQYIGVIDRSDLLAYIEGSDQHFEKIVPEVLDGSKLPKTEKVGETPMAPRKRGGEEIHLFEAKRRRQDSVEISFKEYAMQARPLSDLASAVRRRGKPVAGIKPVLQLACDELKEWSKVTNIPTPKPPREKRPFAHYLNKFIQQDPQKLPIILVPNNKSAPVNKNNARGLLEDGLFSRFERRLLTEEELKAKLSAPKEDRVLVSRRIGKKNWTFEVIDDTSNLSSQDWLRVVAVVTNGEEWEFQGWPFASVVDLLSTIKGFYFREKDRFVEMPDHVNKWQVSVLDLPPKELHHRFAQVRDTFWKEVERFMNSARVKNFKETPLEVTNSRTRAMKLPVL